MVKFKTIKYKHYLEAIDIKNDPEKTDREYEKFVFSLVENWDFKDIETGELIPPGEPNELTIDQFTEVIQRFNGTFGASSHVKKTSDRPSSSGSTRRKTTAKAR